MVVGFSLKMAIRFLRSRKRGASRFTAYAAVIGIAAGVGGLITAMALAQGFQDEIRTKVLGDKPGIYVADAGDARIGNIRFVSKKLVGIKGVKAVESVFELNAAIAGAENSSFIKLHAEGTLEDTQIPNNEIPKIVLPARIAREISVSKGETAELSFLGEKKKPVTAEVKISKLTNAEEAAVLPVVRTNTRDFFKITNGERSYFTALGIKLAPGADSKDVEKRVKKLLGGGFQIVSAEELNKPLFTALRAESRVTYAIILLILLIAVLNVSTNVSLLVTVRKDEIAMLRAAGASANRVTRIFFYEGMILCLLGICCGIASAIIICRVGNQFKLINLPEEIYLISYVPFNLNPESVITVVLGAIILCMAAVIYPSRRVINVKPEELFRR